MSADCPPPSITLCLYYVCAKAGEVNIYREETLMATQGTHRQGVSVCLSVPTISCLCVSVSVCLSVTTFSF